MDTKNVVITGATGGIGQELARSFVRAGHRVVLAARGVDRADALRRVLDAELGTGQVSVAEVDLSTLDGARSGAACISEAVPTVDLLVANAGIFLGAPAASADGYELHLAVMHLGHSQLLRDLGSIMPGPEARFVSVSAWGHRFGRLDPTRLAEDQPSGFAAYCRAKLAQVLYVEELSRRRSDLTAVAVHPGVVATELGAEGLPSAFERVLGVMAAPPRRAAEEIAALSERKDLASGAYFSFRTMTRSMSPRPVRPGRRARDVSLGAALFDATERALLPSTATL